MLLTTATKSSTVNPAASCIASVCYIAPCMCSSSIHVVKSFSRSALMKKDRQPGLWDSSASGHVDSGEDYDTTAVREVREEIGLMLPHSPTRLFKIDACAETDQEFVWVYRCENEGHVSS